MNVIVFEFALVGVSGLVLVMLGKVLLQLRGLNGDGLKE